MRIYVRTLVGKYIDLDVQPSDLIIDVKKMIEEKEGIPISKQRLSTDNRMLENDVKLSDYNILKGMTIYLTVRLI